MIQDKMYILCADLEGVFTPEIWVNVAKKTGIEKFKLTTRDISDYDVLMKQRIKILADNNLKIKDIQNVIKTMSPLPGAVEFLDRLRSVMPVIIVSDTFTQFAGPLMEKLGWPTLFCNKLAIKPDGTVSGYMMRQKDGKMHVASTLKNLNYSVIGVGDSYNDIAMLKEADMGILFRPPENIVNEFPQFPCFHDYDLLLEHFANQGII